MAESHSSRNFLRFLSYVKPYSLYVLLAVVGGIGKFTLPLLAPQVTRYLIDDVFLSATLTREQKLGELQLYIGGLTAVFLFLYPPMVYLRHFYADKAGQKSIFDLRCDLYYKMLRMSASFFSRNKSGGLTSRVINDISLAQNLVGTALTNIWMDAASLVVVLYFIFRIDVGTALVSLCTFPAYVVVIKRFGHRIREESSHAQQETEFMAGNVTEKIAGSRVVHAFGQERNEDRRFHNDQAKLFHTNMRRNVYQSLSVMITAVLSCVAPLLVFLYGGYKTVNGTLTVGELMAVSLYLGPLYLPVQRFAELNVVLSTSLAALDRIFEIMDIEPEIGNAPGAVKLPEARGEVEFRDVEFAYAPGAAPVLRGISFRVRPGEKIALVGESGSGKSTLASLVPRFYDVTGGGVLLDGVDVRNINLKSLRSHIGVVLQEPVLFSGTVRDNILYGRPRATEAELLDACRAASALGFIEALPEGFYAEVGERGLALSGGQKQRITIARAFLKDPRILILDEATSALDSESERLIQDALDRLMRGRTTFIIAHRLSTIVNADRILVLRGGRIAESGTHAELLLHGEYYRRLYEKQFESLPE